MIKLYDTRRRQKVDFEPVEPEHGSDDEGLAKLNGLLAVLQIGNEARTAPAILGHLLLRIAELFATRTNGLPQDLHRVNAHDALITYREYLPIENYIITDRE